MLTAADATRAIRAVRNVPGAGQRSTTRFRRARIDATPITRRRLTMNCVDSKGQPKKRYDSEHEALNTADYGRSARGVDLRVYECSDCGGWHLTSRPAMGGGWGSDSRSRW